MGVSHVVGTVYILCVVKCTSALVVTEPLVGAAS